MSQASLYMFDLSLISDQIISLLFHYFQCSKLLVPFFLLYFIPPWPLHLFIALC